MPRDMHQFREPSFNRREHEGSSRYRPRERTPPPPGISRRHEESRERARRDKDPLVVRRSRSPLSDRRRARDSLERMPGYYELQNEVMPVPRSRERHDSPRGNASRVLLDAPFTPARPKYVEDRFADRQSMHWGDSSREIVSPTTGHSLSQQYPDNASDIPVIPEFNPETSKLNSKDWLYLLESTAKERGWKQDEKLYIMTSRLAGFARQWYLSTGVNYKSWSDLRSTFLKAFPSELDYHALLSRMMARVRDKSESLSTYFLHKVALLNECEIQGVKAVSCIISGLSNSKIEQQARMEKCEDPDQLYLFLRSLNHDGPGMTAATTKKPQNATPKEGKPGSAKKKDCYFCGNVGHIVLNCPYMKKHKCSVCHQIGHECGPITVLGKGGRSIDNQVMEGSLANIEVQPKYFTEVVINRTVLKAYVDFGSDCVTIREEDADRARLVYKKQHKVIRGFAGSPLSSIGYSDTAICIDKAVADIRISVVPNNIQRIPVVVGRSFTQHPHVLVMKDAGELRFYQRAGNGETNFDF